MNENKRYPTISYLFLLFTSVCILSCSSQKETPLMEPEEEPEIEQINYLALGDSYTIGQGVDEDQRWPNQLGELLKSMDYEIENVEIIAKTGWTTTNLLDAIEVSNTSDYNLVSLLIGVNNQYQNKPFELFVTEFEELLDQSIEIAGEKNRVFVVSIPDYGVTPFGSSNSEKIGLEIDMYNQLISDRCEANQIPFIDITEISRNLGAKEGALASDNLHPSGSQYTDWTNEILPFVIKLLNP